MTILMSLSIVPAFGHNSFVVYTGLLSLVCVTSLGSASDRNLARTQSFVEVDNTITVHIMILPFDGISLEIAETQVFCHVLKVLLFVKSTRAVRHMIKHLDRLQLIAVHVMVNS